MSLAHELTEAIYRFPFTGQDLRIVLFILRFTYGFNRKSANLSISFISKGTGIKRREVSRSLKMLVGQKTLVREYGLTKINKNYDEWVVGQKTLRRGVVGQKTHLLVSSSPPKKENIKKTLSPSSDDFERFWSLYPKKVGKKDASKAWSKIESSSVPDLIKGVEIQSESEQWKKDGGRYIPHPATWLRGERWKDCEEEPEPPPDPELLKKLKELQSRP